MKFKLKHWHDFLDGFEEILDKEEFHFAKDVDLPEGLWEKYLEAEGMYKHFCNKIYEFYRDA